MTDGGGPGGMSFPMKVHTDDEDFVIELEDNSVNSQPDGFGIDGERGRCKRRKRCGQCGPCQVKENCNQCHFCIRKDVLKQTCIYRKCVYLRSKPKPYARPQQSPQRASRTPSDRMSPTRSLSPNMRTPSGSGTINAGLPYQEVASATEARNENPFFPPNLPQQPIDPVGNSEFDSLGGALSGRGQPLAPDNAAANMNMHMNANMIASSPVHKTPEVAPSPVVQSPHLQSNHVQSPHVQSPMAQSPLVQSPPTINSPPNVMPGISSVPVPPISNPVLAPPISPMASVSNTMMPHRMSGLPSMPNTGFPGSLHVPSMTNTALPVPPMPAIPSLPSIPSIDRGMGEFRHPEQMPPPPHHPHPYFSPVHPHPPHQMPHRDPTMLDPHVRVPHMGFTPPNHFDSMSRGTSDSSCMYHPGLPYSMSGPFHQPTGSFFSSGPDMFRSQFLPPFASSYSAYPSNRYRESFGSGPFSGLPMPPSSHLTQYPGPTPRFGSGIGMGQSFTQQYSPYSSHNGCPKNGSCPPVSPSIDDVKVLQEGYKKIERSNSSVSANSSASSLWEPWRLPSWFSPRHDEVRSRMSTSTLSSDFECDVISIDDHQMNAMIRSDGCNSIEIEFDKRSSSDESSPRKLPSQCSSSSELNTPVKKLGFRPIGGHPFPGRSLFTDSTYSHDDTSSDEEGISANVKVDRGFRNSEKQNSVNWDKTSNDTNNRKTNNGKEKLGHLEGESGTSRKTENKKSDKLRAEKKKIYFKGLVCLKQDLGDEGIVQLTLPGHRVSIADITLDDELAKSSSNLEELLEFISKKPKQAVQRTQSQEPVLVC